MSNRYSIYADLNEQYLATTIKAILEKAKNLGYIFFPVYPGECPSNSSPLDIENATTLILNGNEDGLHCIVLKIQNTYAVLYILNENEKIAIAFSNFMYPWQKILADGSEALDITKYATALFDIINDYKIEKITIKRDK